MTSFIRTATAASAEVAEDLARSEARSAALDTFGAKTEFVSFDEVRVQFNDNGTYTATYTTNAVEGDVPPEVSIIVTEGEDNFIVTEGGLRMLPEDVDAQVPEGEDNFIVTEGGLRMLPEDVDQEESEGEDNFIVTEGGLRMLPEDVDTQVPEGFIDNGDGLLVLDEDLIQQDIDQEESEAANAIEIKKDAARQQQTVASQRGQIKNGDWRVRLTLAPNSQYLYNAEDPGILAPLQPTNGIIFPYTPTIDTNYKANYSSYDLTHSNYRGYFYQNSYVDAINLKCTFTAQSTQDADYLLAVIHFLRSATKMFYGAKDTNAGSPPPLVFLTGFGQYQFNNHSCVISQFNYNLPSDVDYIRAGSKGNSGINLSTQRNRTSVALPGLGGSFAGLQRLASVFMPKGGVATPPGPSTGQLGTNEPTYVPTKMEISLSLLPVQSRSQVSKLFDLKQFANGSQLKGGFW